MTDIRVETGEKPAKRKARTNMVMVRFTDEGADIMDKLRGSKSRQDYLRGLVAADYVRAKKDGTL